jgi:large subunit ribosomal protein L29
MKATELRTKSESELKDMIIQLKREILNLSFQRVNGQLTNPSRFRTAGREVARIKTIIKENQVKNG